MIGDEPTNTDPLQKLRAVVDADLSGYFDSIPHAELMLCVARRVSDKAMLHLVKQWLVTPVEETDERGRVRRTTRNKDTKRGTPVVGSVGGCGANWNSMGRVSANTPTSGWNASSAC